MSRIAMEVKNLTKSYHGNTVLSGVSMRLEEGRFYTLLGQNGAGKSTLMRILSRTETADSGDGHAFSENIFNDSATINENVGYVSESVNFSVPLPIGKFVDFYGKFFPRWDRALFSKLMKELELDEGKYFHALSRGQKMQVAFAATAATKPKLIIIDEITAVLDAHARAYVMGYLGQYVKEGGTVLMATNIVSEVQFFADHLFLLKQGKVYLDVPRNEFHLLFLKLRKIRIEDHDVFHDPNCVEVALNSDDSTSFLIPMKDVQKYKLKEALFDNRGITAEEIFIYYTKGKRA